MTRRFRAFTTLYLVGVLLTAAPGPARAAVPGLTARLVVGGLNQPVAFTFDPAGNIWFVEKSTGMIRTFNRTTRKFHRFYRVPGVNGEGERGMLGIALHPDFPAQPFVYVYATRSVNGHLRNQILRLTRRSGRGSALKVLLTSVAAASPYHNGGRIEFGPDKKLYAIVGDGHDSTNAQLLGNNRGKMLRLTATGAVPPGNPFPGSFVFAFGVRNSFGFDFDPQTRDLWETENGPQCNDELNRILAGQNYAWGPSEDCLMGTSPTNTNNSGPSPRQLPEYWFDNTIGITGMAFCDTCHLDAPSEGTFFFGEVNGNDIRRATLNPARTSIGTVEVVYTAADSPISFETSPAGDIFFSTFSGIYRLVI